MASAKAAYDLETTGISNRITTGQYIIDNWFNMPRVNNGTELATYRADWDIAPRIDGQDAPDGKVNFLDYMLWVYYAHDITGFVQNLRQKAADSYQSSIDEINSRQFVPQYAVGTSYLASDQYAMVHAGEAIIDAQSNAVLQKYGIKVQVNGDGELIEEIRALRQEVAELKAHAAANVRVDQAVGTRLIEIAEKQAGAQVVLAREAIRENAA